MDKQALLAKAGFIHQVIPLPLGVHRVANVAVEHITELEAEVERLKEALKSCQLAVENREAARQEYLRQRLAAKRIWELMGRAAPASLHFEEPNDE